MPGVDSLLGGGSASNLPGAMPGMTPGSSYTDTLSNGGSNTNNEEEEIDFQKQGQTRKDPDLLTPDDISALDSKYDSIRSQSEQRVADELSKGSSGQLNDDGVGKLGGKKGAATAGGLNITQDEAKKIVDYTIEEEKLTEKRELDDRKKKELVAGWENEGRMKEESVERELDSGSGGDLVEKDGVAREIIQNDEIRTERREERNEKIGELDFYQRQLSQRREVEGVVEKAAQKIQSEKNVDIDDVYEKSLDEIQSSRRTKLGPPTLGVLGNSMPLEQGREYVRSQKANKEFIKDVEKEAGIFGVNIEDEERFFRPPKSYEEERMYRSIVRQIVEKRVDPPPEPVEVGSDDVEVGGVIMGAREEETAVKAKYQLSAKETVEAYKLLNLWREMHNEQDAMEKALGMKDDSDGMNGRRPLNKLEPFFLYEEDSEEKRQKERDNMIKVLKKGLQSDDAVENSSSELLMKELLEGGVTKNRAVRLLDKLLAKAKSDTIRSSLEELKVTILEDDDSNGNGGDNGFQGGEDEVSRSLLFRKSKKSGGGGGPIDLSGVFRTSDVDEEEEAKAPPPVSSKPIEPAVASGRTMPSWAGEEEKKETKDEELPILPPPSTPFFSSSVAEAETADVKAPPPPKTPFFSGTEEGETASSEDKSPTGGMFGTYEEQKLQRLASKVGAQTEEEMEELRRNMEALKEAEEMANAQLSDDDFDIEAATAKLGIDVDSLNLDDDSDDQIMSVLGKRPVSSTPPLSSKKAILEFNEEESDDIIVDATGHLKKMDVSEEEKRDIADDIFRAKTAGRYSDKEARDADEVAFKELIKMEEDIEKQLDSMKNETDIDDIDAYAEDIMSEIKPRPRVRGRKEDFMSQEEIQWERKKESIFGDDDPFPVRDDDGGQRSPSSFGSGNDMPEWFRKEQEDLGIKVEDINEDDYDEARRKWEREERQRKADEYLKQRGEGISISDVLGREYFGPMDEPDDDYKAQPPLLDSFEPRKELLLGYTELTVEDINNVVDYKVDPLATGYNQYLPKVQQPFSGYASIFRLEGVLVDMVGLHAKAWKKVAETHAEYQIESSDEVRQASLYTPEEAVREVFRWTDDIFELKDICETHRAAFNEAFDEWLESGRNVATASSEYEQVSGSDSPNTPSESPKTTPSDEEMNSMYYLAWSKLAANLDKTAPTNDEVYRGIMGGDWEVAVKDIYGWSEDPNEVYDIVVAYDEILQGDYKVLLEKYGIDLDKMDAEQEESQFGLTFPDVALQEGVKDWLDTLREVDMPIAIVTHLDSTQLDAVLSATGLADYFPPDKRVSSDSNYSSERSDLLGAALRVEQRPDKCVVFDNTPHSANEAHEVCMKCVSFVDHYARYELLTADHSVGYAGDLDLISFVKIFDERTDLELEVDVSSALIKEQRKAKTAFWDE